MPRFFHENFNILSKTAIWQHPNTQVIKTTSEGRNDSLQNKNESSTAFVNCCWKSNYSSRRYTATCYYRLATVRNPNFRYTTFYFPLVCVYQIEYKSFKFDRYSVGEILQPRNRLYLHKKVIFLFIQMPNLKAFKW